MKTTKIGAVMSGDVVTAQHGTPFKDVVRLLPYGRPGRGVVKGSCHVIGLLAIAAASGPIGPGGPGFRWCAGSGGKDP
ncbi:hypothetical protein HKX69_33500 [Streptomyces argyrophyllae]|uniref:Uncharacterized protein n=1 Tax=Streptomyces argyrophylli TaxID=2726118 RepID=A0A6M4PT54_9ACTN|nr:hypothetical protein [Streptomyces argyrophyllae]QJS13809.1 hypothetical protein HKX69_33500 [Streptomyces argyrophyllae]